MLSDITGVVEHVKVDDYTTSLVASLVQMSQYLPNSALDLRPSSGLPSITEPYRRRKHWLQLGNTHIH